MMYSSEPTTKLVSIQDELIQAYIAKIKLLEDEIKLLKEQIKLYDEFRETTHEILRKV